MKYLHKDIIETSSATICGTESCVWFPVGLTDPVVSWSVMNLITHGGGVWRGGCWGDGWDQVIPTKYEELTNIYYGSQGRAMAGRGFAAP